MKSLSVKSPKTLRPKAIFCVLLISLSCATSSFSWTDELFEAVKAMESGKATSYHEGLILKNNREINQMRIKGVISDDVFQRSQAYYNQITTATATAAAERQGSVLERQKTAFSKPIDAGTDTDFILKKAESAEQIKKIRNTFNDDFSEIIRKKGVDPAGIDFATKNDVDFMADPDGVSQAEFEKIAQINNDAYKRPGAASFEANARTGRAQSYVETMAYKEEMADLQLKKARQVQERAQELARHRKQYPDPAAEPPDAFIRRMQLEADLQRVQAQRSKYYQRAQQATLELAKMAGDTTVWDPTSGQQRKVAMEDLIKASQSALPGKAKQRAPSADVSQRQREITSVTANSLSAHLKYQDTINEVRVLAQLSQHHPDRIPELQQRIIQLSEGLPPAQRGEMLAHLHDSNASPRLVSGITREMQKHPDSPQIQGKTAVVPGGRLHKVGYAMGLIGDIMSISSELDKASRGEHLFFNLAKTDSDLEKLLKMSAVAGIELAPIPVIDLLERTKSADQRAQDYINDLARRGVTGWQADPAFVMFAAVSTVSFDTFNAMFVDPLTKGGEAVMETGYLFRDTGRNFLADFRHAEQQRLLREMKSASHARAQAFDLGGLYGRRGGFEGGPLAGEVAVGETIAFVVQKNDRWTNDYFVRWELTTPDGRTDILQPITKPGDYEASMRADDPEAARRRIDVGAGFLPGAHTVTIRIFESASKLQVDSRDATFTVSGKIGIGPIAAARDKYLHENGTPLFSTTGGQQLITLKPGDILAFNVARIGRWTKEHEVQWLVNGENYKTQNGENQNADRLRFDSTRMDSGNYRVAVRIIDTAGPTRKILGHQQIEIRLGKQQKKAEPFSIRATLGDYNGPPLASALRNGDILALQAVIKHTYPAEPAQLFWQVLDAAGRPLAGLAKQEQVTEPTGTGNYRFRFQLGSFEQGEYQVVLKHFLTAHSESVTSATLSFRVVSTNPVEKTLDIPSDKRTSTSPVAVLSRQSKDPTYIPPAPKFSSPPKYSPPPVAPRLSPSAPVPAFPSYSGKESASFPRQGPIPEPRVKVPQKESKPQIVYWVVNTSTWSRNSNATTMRAQVTTGNQPPVTGFSQPVSGTAGHYHVVVKAYGTLEPREAQQIANDINQGKYRDVFSRTRFDSSGHIGKGLEGTPLVNYGPGVEALIGPAQVTRASGEDAGKSSSAFRDEAVKRLKALAPNLEMGVRKMAGDISVLQYSIDNSKKTLARDLAELKSIATPLGAKARTMTREQFMARYGAEFQRAAQLETRYNEKTRQHNSLVNKRDSLIKRQKEIATLHDVISLAWRTGNIERCIEIANDSPLAKEFGYKPLYK